MDGHCLQLSGLSIVAEDREPSPEILQDEEVEEEEEGGGEEDGDEDEEDPDATKVAEPSEDGFGNDLLHPSPYDAMSDTTINTRHTTRMLETIDSESAVESLSALYAMALQIIKKSTNSSFPKDMERYLEGLRSWCDIFKDLKKPYGTGIFIEVEMVLRKLFGSKLPEETAIPLSEILHSANLATLTSKVYEQRQMDQDLDESNQQNLKVFLQSLEKTFPDPFVSSLAAASYASKTHKDSELVQESFNVILDIRTQLFISVSRQLEYQPDFDPDKVLISLFLENVNEKRNFGDISLEEQRDRTGDRMDQIRFTFKQPEQATGPGEYIDFEALDDLYPKSEFYGNLFSYGIKRLVEVENTIEAHGGIGKVTKSLEDFVKEIDEGSEAENQSDSEPEIQVPLPKNVAEREGILASNKMSASVPSSKPQPE